MTGDSESPILNTVNTTTWSDLQYPALNGKSALVPYTTSTQLFQNGVGVWWADNYCTTTNCDYSMLYCADILESNDKSVPSFDTLVGEYILGDVES